MKRYFILLILLLLISLVIFYFWASSSKLDKNDHVTIKQYPVNDIPVKDTLSIMTYNIGYLSGMINNLAVQRDYDLCIENLQKSYALIEQYQPDIIGFQEIDYYANRSFFMNQMDSIARHGSYLCGAYGINWDKKYVPFPYWPPSVHFGKMLSGQGILSVYPIIMNRKIVLEKPENNPFYYNAFYLDRLIQVSHIEIGQEIVIMNVHLEAFDGITREIQIKRVIEEYQTYSDDFPVLLIGDFNCEPPYAESSQKDEGTIKWLLETEDIAQAIPDSIYLENPSAYLTFDSRKPYQKIDYLFYNPSKIICLEAYVAKEAGEISDHFPVFMKFTLKNELPASFGNENSTRNKGMKTHRSNSPFGFCLPANPALKNQKSYFLPTLRINRNFEKS